MKAVLVYDIRRDHVLQSELLSRVQDQWKAYLCGGEPHQIAEGRIAELFYAPYEGEHMFRLDEGARTTCWTRLGDKAWYAVGQHARIEHVIFHLPPPIGDMQIATRIWIGDDAVGNQ